MKISKPPIDFIDFFMIFLGEIAFLTKILLNYGLKENNLTDGTCCQTFSTL